MKSISNPVAYGLCFLMVCLVILTIPALNAVTENSATAIRALVTLIPIFLYGLMLGLHVGGYIELGNELESRSLSLSALALKYGFIIFGFAVSATILVGVAQYAQIVTSEGGALINRTTNGIVGLVICVFAIPALVFAVSLAMHLKRLGVVVIPVMILPVCAVWFMWRPWFVILLALSSVYLLYRGKLQ